MAKKNLTFCGNTAYQQKNTILYQTYYNEETKKHLDGQFIPYFNAKCNKYFDNQIIMDMYDAGLIKNSDYFGVFSWCAKQKMKWIDFYRFVNDNPDCDYFYVDQSDHAWKHCDISHGADCSTWVEYILDKIGFPNIDLIKLEIPLAICNFQICKTNMYSEYVSKCLKPFVQVMESDMPKLKEWLYEDSRYTSQNPLTEEKLVGICGVPYYPKHTFLAERLFITYATIMNWKGRIMTTSKKLR